MILKPNQYSKWMCNCKVSQEAFDQRLRNPPVMEKDAAPLSIWGDIVDNPELDPASHLPRCTGANVKCIYALQLDYDDNSITMEQWSKKYSPYTHVAYTSSGYGIKPGERFRVLIPLSEPIYTEDMTPLLKRKMQFQFACDPTCFDRGHFQILPVLRKFGQPYKWIRNEGKTLDWFPRDYCQDLRKQWEEEVAEREHKRKEATDEDSHEGALRWAQNEIYKTPKGGRNSSFFKLLGWLKSKGASAAEVRDLEWPVDMAKEIESMITRLFA